MRNDKPLIAVTGSDKPYLYDLPHLLSLPAGFEFRFRYRHEWIEEELAAAIVRDPKSVRGRGLFIVFHSTSRSKVLPVRRATVVDVESAGAVVYLRFRVGGFIAVPRKASLGPEPADDAADKLHAVAAVLFGTAIKEKDLARSLGPGMYLRPAQGADDKTLWSAAEGAAAADQWQVLAQVLDDESALWDVPMFYLLGLQRESGTYAGMGPLLMRSAFVEGCSRVRAVKLVEGERYKLRVLEWCKPKDAGKPLAVNVTCKFDENMLRLESAASLVVGKYDILEFSLLAKATGFGHLELRADPETNQSAGVNRPDWPRLYAARVPVRVRPNIWRVAASLLFFGAGVLLHMFAAKVEEKTKIRANISELIGTVLLLVTLGEFVSRFLKFNKALQEYEHPQPPKP
jgi:hypothetical protein